MRGHGRYMFPYTFYFLDKLFGVYENLSSFQIEKSSFFRIVRASLLRQPRAMWREQVHVPKTARAS